MRKMRTINEAHKLVKEADKNSGVTLNCIRALCKQGKIHTVLVGKKYLLDADELFAYFNKS